MSIIAVSGIPVKWNMKLVMVNLLKVIKGKFEVLNILCNKKLRTSYIRLSERLDPQLVIEKINGTKIKNLRLRAAIPKEVPDVPMRAKPRGIPPQMRRALQIPNESTPGEALLAAHTEIMIEIQSKYTGLYNVSKKSDHLLLKNIARTIFERLKDIIETTPAADTSFKLTKCYRKKHPHFADFQLILSTLHNLEDAEGHPRTQLNRQEFCAPSDQPYFIDNVPYNKVQEICAKYTKSITKKITDHVNNLKTDLSPESNAEEAPHKRVREELKKLMPYFPLIIKQVVLKNFVPQKLAYYKIRIYGEPFMPSKEVMVQFLKRYNAVKAFRCERAYNLLRCKVPLRTVTALLACDGTVIGGATLYIRLADVPSYKTSDAMKDEIKSAFDEIKTIPAAEQMCEEVEVWSENW